MHSNTVKQRDGETEARQEIGSTLNESIGGGDTADVGCRSNRHPISIFSCFHPKSSSPPLVGRPMGRRRNGAVGLGRPRYRGHFAWFIILIIVQHFTALETDAQRISAQSIRGHGYKSRRCMCSPSSPLPRSNSGALGPSKMPRASQRLSLYQRNRIRQRLA
jgi:hypothetical protein